MQLRHALLLGCAASAVLPVPMWQDFVATSLSLLHTVFIGTNLPLANMSSSSDAFGSSFFTQSVSQRE